MPSGDAQRVWFPEMLDELKQTWSVSMTWDELADFCRRMTKMRLAIREKRGIQSPRFRCPVCNAVTRARFHQVSVRSALFALRKIGAIGEEEFKALDKSWKKHRATAHVDAYGRKHAASEDRELGREPEHRSDASAQTTNHTKGGCGSELPPNGSS